MKPHLKPLVAAIAMLAAITPSDLLADPGRIEAVRGSVSFVRGTVIQRMAASSTLNAGDGVRTGTGGQSQIDAGGATVRAGSNTDLVLKEQRDGLTLKNGIVLVSNKSQSRGFDLVTDQHKATSYGTMQVSYLKGKYLKVLCIEGKVKVGLKALMGDSVTLREGQMVTITPTEERMPEPIMVNLSRVANTSALLGPGFVVRSLSFPGGPRVTAAVAGQEAALAQATAGVGKNSRNKSLAESPQTMDYLSQLRQAENQSESFGPGMEYFARLQGRPSTPTNMFKVLSEASKGAPFNSYGSN
jgi:hypothetical protein